MSSHDKTFCACCHVIFLFGTTTKLKSNTQNKPETKKTPPDIGGVFLFSCQPYQMVETVATNVLSVSV